MHRLTSLTVCGRLLLATILVAGASLARAETATSVPQPQPSAASDSAPGNESALERSAPADATPSTIETGTVTAPPLAIAQDAASALPEALTGALRAVLDQPPEGKAAARELSGIEKDRDALAAFYRQRNAEPLWVAADGPTPRGVALRNEIANAAAYGLDPSAFDLPEFDAGATAAQLGAIDYQLSRAALTYARHARGGRIPEPARLLNSNLDRKPQVHDPKDVLERLARASDVAAELAALHPVHPQFEKLRQAFLAETKDGKGGGKLNATAKRLRANMEFWRWMWDDLGELHIFNNLPEYMQYVVKDGKVVRSERIVVGEIGKQSSVFSRPLKSVVLRPRWRVPESIMVHELWPNLRRGGGQMRRYGLEITTKSGQSRDWRTIDWNHDDIRNYHVWQPPGRGSVLGFVKFSFPSQHTIFMHDTPDKWMFNSRQRTLSHGCLRVRNPMGLVEIVLGHDRGWDRAKIKALIDKGPLDNDVEMEKHIPVHLAYFTAWVADDGKVKTFRDIYGHEKRVTQALDGDWKRINKGRNHLAPPQPKFDKNKVAQSPPAKRRKKGESASSIFGDAFGLPF